MEASKRGSLHATRIDISLEVRLKAIDILGQTLANCADLKSQVKQAHWNVKGPEFIALHKLFDEFAEGLEDYVDAFAERIVMLGGTAMGTVRMAAATTNLPEFQTQPQDGMSYASVVAERFALFGKNLRDGANDLEAVGDPTTANYYLEVAYQIDKWLWFIEAHRQ